MSVTTVVPGSSAVSHSFLSEACIAIGRVEDEVRECQSFAPGSLGDLNAAIIRIEKSIEAIRGQLQTAAVSREVARKFNIVIGDYDNLRDRVNLINGNFITPYPSIPSFVPQALLAPLPRVSRPPDPSPEEMLASARGAALAQVARLSTLAKRPPVKIMTASVLQSSTSPGSKPPLPQPGLAPGGASSSSAAFSGSSTSSPVLPQSGASSSSTAPSPSSSVPAPIAPFATIGPRELENLRGTGVHTALDTCFTMLRDTVFNSSSEGMLVSSSNGIVTAGPRESATVHGGNFDKCVYAFSQSGGRILPVTRIEAHAPPAHTMRIPLDPSIKIFVMDPDGGICSHLAVSELRNFMGTLRDPMTNKLVSPVQDPHGALYSVDPVVIPHPSLQEKALFINAHPEMTDEYVRDFQASGYPLFTPHNPSLRERIGIGSHRYDEGNLSAAGRLQILKRTDKDVKVDKEIFLNLQAQRCRVDALLWDRMHEDGAQVITINGAVHPVVFRDTERAKIRGAKGLSSQPRTIIPLTCNFPTEDGPQGREAQAAWINNFRAAIRQLFVPVVAPAKRA